MGSEVEAVTRIEPVRVHQHRASSGLSYYDCTFKWAVRWGEAGGNEVEAAVREAINDRLIALHDDIVSFLADKAKE